MVGQSEDRACASCLHFCAVNLFPEVGGANHFVQSDMAMMDSSHLSDCVSLCRTWSCWTDGVRSCELVLGPKIRTSKKLGPQPNAESVSPGESEAVSPSFVSADPRASVTHVDGSFVAP